MRRRRVLQVLGGLPVAGALPKPTAASVAVPLSSAPVPKARFLTAEEWQAATVLADLILPRDERSGSASEAGVVAYIDEYADYFGEEIQTRVRGGLRWLDRECGVRFGRGFVSCSAAEHEQLMGQLASPAEPVARNLAPGVAFFAFFRQLTVDGFYTSAIGIADLGYEGNQPSVWEGCPKDVLRQLGLDEDEPHSQ
jgi:hypothetical protein